MGNTFTTAGTNYFSFEKFQWFVVSSTAVEDDDDLDDPVERMLKKTGCLEKHYAVQECIAETKDWRQCQKHVKDFRECMEKHKKNTSVSS